MQNKKCLNGNHNYSPLFLDTRLLQQPVFSE
nr:MAG TPA: hypothetical protein [Caudoviricetes sp.]